MKIHLLTIFIFCGLFANAQDQKKDSIPEEEDFSKYANVEEASSSGSGSKKYCSQKVLGLSPSKLISLGFDFVGPSQLETDTVLNFLASNANIKSNTGVRFLANFPVISNQKMILNLGVNYLNFKYNFEDAANTANPLNRTLTSTGLTSYGVNAILFKPLNEKRFLLIQTSLDFNGDFTIIPTSKSLKISGAAIYGFKPHERLQYGFGVTRTYRAGEVNYLPILLYNYTFVNKKWGIEMLLPARANVRYTINPRNLLFAGFELEGNSYHLINSRKNIFNSSFNPYKNVQLRRSEIRPRITYECSLYKFIWLSVQAGYRINYRFNVDDGEYYRAFGDKPAYLMENNLTSAYYFNISINLVSP